MGPFNDWMYDMVTTLVSNALPATLATHVGHWGPGWGFGWWWFLIPLFWIGIFVLIFSLVGRRWRRARWAGYDGPPPWSRGASEASAEKVLAERFARGDIDEVEYRARLEVLRANRPDSR